jgi:hypothetical protein
MSGQDFLRLCPKSHVDIWNELLFHEVNECVCTTCV